MARSENTGLQVALIIFVVVALILGVTTFVFFKQLRETQDQLVQAVDNANNNEKLYRDLTEEAKQLRVIILGPGPANETKKLEDVQATFNDDVAKYAATLATDDNRCYSLALQKQFSAVTETKKNQLTETEAKEDISQKYKVREGISAGQLTQASEGQQKAQGDLAEQAAKFKEEQERVAKEKQEQVAQFAASLEDVNKKLETAQAEAEKFKALLAKETAEVASRNKKIEQFTGAVLDVPDGEIKWVDQRNRTVWINLGSADYLPAQQTFSVYASNVTQMDKDTTRKGAIQVIRILQEHLAEARITDYDLKDPLMAGDRIYTPAWHPGRQEHFGLSGLLDINDDGQPDNEVIKNLIALSGGVVDEEVNAEGKRVGTGITLNTRYLIKGAGAGEKTAPGAMVAKMGKASAELEADARRLGVRTISLEEFLDMIGYQAGAESWVPVTGETYDLKQGQNKPAKPTFGANSEFFKARRPPAAAGSAYGDGK